MSFRLRTALTIATILLTCSFVACGGDPPDREIQQAEAAIASAQTAGADTYAADELTAARTALANAREAVTARDYRLALDRALDSRERAQDAATQTSARIAAMRAAADSAIGTATLAIASGKTAIQMAEAAHGPARPIAAVKTSVDSADALLQKARTAWEVKDFQAATTAAASAAEQMAAIADDLETILPGRRRR